MMYLKILTLGLSFIFLGCQAEKTTQETPKSETKKAIRSDLKDWIDEEFSDKKNLKAAVKDLARTPPESCEFKDKVECIEKLVGFDQALEIELEMMKRVLNSPERQKQFDENIEKCHFSAGMDKKTCIYEK